MEATRTVVLPLEDHPALSRTLEQTARAYAIISEAAFQNRTRSSAALQKLVYSNVRAQTTLTAQMTCSAIRKVAAAYKSIRSNGQKIDEPARFASKCLDLQGGVRGRDFKVYSDRGIVSISTVEGRKKLPYRCGEHQRRYLDAREWRVRSARLLYKRRRRSQGYRYELHVQVVRREAPRKSPPGDILGVDTGRRYLAVGSIGADAHFFPAGHLKPRKEHYRRLRGRLKSKGTRSSVRTCESVSGRETRLTLDFQHRTANGLVDAALRGGCGAIAVERLTGLRQRTGAKGPKARYHHASWAYGRFLDILRYKAEGEGLEFVEVDPSNTSCTCSRCGWVGRAGRKGLSFRCTSCGYELHADLNASRNVRLRAILRRQDLVEDGPESCGPEAGSGEAETAPIGGWTEAEGHGKLAALAVST